MEIMDTKNIFKEFNPNLVHSLPLKDPIFIAKLTQQNLFSGNLKAEVMAVPTQADAATSFLHKVVERSLDVGDTEPFVKLLLVMEEFDNLTLNKLAREIKRNLKIRVRLV